MLAAVLEDFRCIPGVEPVNMPSDAGREAFEELVRSSDCTLLIAPEFDGLLAGLCRRVEQAGGRLIGPSSEAVKLTGDKVRLARHLSEAGVPTPGCYAPGEPVPFPAVLKPRDGAGSQATFLVHDREELSRCRAAALAEGWRGELIVQPYVRGTAASVAFLVGPADCLPLLPAAQHLSDDGRFHYQGGRVPLPSELCERAVAVARPAVLAVPGLRGYVGVDLVLGETDQVLEINPRLTTSYVGLRALALTNLAEAMLRVADGNALAIHWREGAVEFRADGTVSACS
jgi:predicted ATP-grasp superfamily ATP-dependent carboligase